MESNEDDIKKQTKSNLTDLVNKDKHLKDLKNRYVDNEMRKNNASHALQLAKEIKFSLD